MRGLPKPKVNEARHHGTAKTALPATVHAGTEQAGCPVAYGEQMSEEWSDVPPALLDRRSHARAQGVPADADAVLVGARGVVMGASGVLTVPPASQPEAALRVYLGRHDGRDYCAVVPRREDAAVAGEWTGLRDIIAGEPTPLDRELAVTATAAAHWHEAHQRCAQCGELTAVAEAGSCLRPPFLSADGPGHHCGDC